MDLIQKNRTRISYAELFEINEVDCYNADLVLQCELEKVESSVVVISQYN